MTWHLLYYAYDAHSFKVALIAITKVHKDFVYRCLSIEERTEVEDMQEHLLLGLEGFDRYDVATLDSVVTESIKLVKSMANQEAQYSTIAQFVFFKGNQYFFITFADL